MTGIAITLATREDREAVAAIEKLTGLKIARVGESGAKAELAEEAPVEAPAPKAEKRAEPRRERKEEPRRESKSEARPEPKEEPRRASVDEPRREREEAPERERKSEPSRARPEPKAKAEPRRQPKPEPAEGDDDGWNGPMPSFLSKSAL